MASTSKFVYVFVMALFCLALTQPPSGQWNCGHGCFYAEGAAQVIPNRKVLQLGMHGGKEEVVGQSGKGRGQLGSTSRNVYGGGGSVRWELRGVPAGPDPLHHRGGGPKMPRRTP